MTQAHTRGLLNGDSPARQVLDLLARRGPQTVRELVDALGVTTTAVRQQVNRLVDDGWLERSRQQGATGRPADVFALSGKARRLYGSRAEDLAQVLIKAIVEELGPQQGRTILKAVGKRLAERAATEVYGGEPGDRLQQLAELLRQEGDIVETDGTGDEQRLAVYTCPYGGLPEEHAEICEMERQAFSEVIGQPLKLARRQPDGHGCCEFKLAGKRRTPSG